MTSLPPVRRQISVRLDQADAVLVRFMTEHGLPLLRLAIAIVYLWFGGLKLIGASPAGELVVKTALLYTLLLLWLQIAGTFQIFFLLPQELFQRGNPLLPTLEGQYALKNIVLITAGLVIGSTVRRARPQE